jgi:Secretion system C-terminal sorting domain
MKKLFIYICSIFATNGTAQVVSSCEIPQELSIAYGDQVKILAIDPMLNSGTADSGSIHILEAFSKPIFESLAAVYNSTFYSEIDSIFNIYCIKNLEVDEASGYTSNEIYISLDTNVAWTQYWLNGIDSSGNAAIDSLLAGVTYAVYQPFLPGTVRLVFEDVLNLVPLVQFLAAVDGVNYAEQVPSYGQDNSITHFQQNSVHFFDFYLGWGDCPSGCTSGRIWRFRVAQPSCEVTFLGASGASIPSFDGYPNETNCNLTSSVNNLSADRFIEVFPNPASDVLHIRTVDEFRALCVYDMLGKCCIKSEPQSNSVSIDVARLTPGIYFLQVDKHLTRAFVKQ